MPGTSDSQPSRPKRFSFGYLDAMKRSNESDHTRRSRMAFFSSVEYFHGSGISMRSRIQSHSSRFGMWMYWMPIEPPAGGVGAEGQ